MDYASPHRVHPTSVLQGENYAPALAIYVDVDTQSVAVTATEVQVTVGPNTVTVNYVGKSLEDVAVEISASHRSVVASALQTGFTLTSGSLYLGTRSTPDGGFVVRIKAHGVRYTAETRIRTLLPYFDARTRPWYPRVDRGSVVVNKNGVRYTFSVPEYQDQVWSPRYGAPFVDQNGVRPIRLSPTVLQVSRTPVLWDGHNVFLSIDGNPLGPSIISDVDIHNGFLYLSTPLPSEAQVVATYTYEERSYVYPRVNLNPSVEHNPNIVDRTVLLYLLPFHASTGRSRSTTLHHAFGQTIAGAMESISQSEEPVLILGAYHVRPMGGALDITHRDTRVRGGGIDQEKYDDALRRNPEVQSVSDAGRWDGIPFPAAAGGVLILPRTLLDTYDADFIQKVADRHLAAGGHILLDFED